MRTVNGLRPCMVPLKLAFASQNQARCAPATGLGRHIVACLRCSAGAANLAAGAACNTLPRQQLQCVTAGGGFAVARTMSVPRIHHCSFSGDLHQKRAVSIVAAARPHSPHQLPDAESLAAASGTSTEEDEAGRSCDSHPWYASEHVIKQQWAASKEEQDFWDGKSQELTSFYATKAARQLDPRWRFGLPYEWLGGDSGSGQATRSEAVVAPSGSKWFRCAKTRNPFALVLIRVGKFYESVGYDAVLLMEYGGYRPMGGLDAVLPRAGCPDVQIHDVLKKLVQEAGLSVAVWEEMPDTKLHGSRRTTQKQRRFAQMVTPENPVYLYNLASTDQELAAEVPDIKGLTLSSSGWTLFNLNRKSDMISVYTNISEDSLWGLLRADSAHKIIVRMHWPLDKPLPQPGVAKSGLEADFIKVHKRLNKDTDACVTIYQSADPLGGFKESLKKTCQWLRADDVLHLPALDLNVHWPGTKPLYQSTLKQLGLLSEPGVPNLLDSLLPSRGPSRLVQQEVKKMLMNPPPHSVAAATRRVVRQLCSEDPSLKVFEYEASGAVTPQQLSALLGANECSSRFFQRLRDALRPVIMTMDPKQSPGLSAVVDDVWPLLCHTMGCQGLDRNVVLQASLHALEAIVEVVPGSPPQGCMTETAHEQESFGLNELVMEALQDFAVPMESYRTRIRHEAILREAEEVDTKFNELAVVLDGLVNTLMCEAQQAGTRCADKKHWPKPYVDKTNSSIWIKLPSKELAGFLHDKSFKIHACNDLQLAPEHRIYRELHHNSGPQLLKTPYDRNGSHVKQKDLRTCDALDEALAGYRGALAAANAAATRELRRLSRQLAPTKLELGAAVQIGILLQALHEHSKAAVSQGWSVPLVGIEEQVQAGVEVGNYPTKHGGLMRFKGLRPTWSIGSGQPVLNDVEVHGANVLMGPNMTGKSTLLRALGLASLCANVGLAVPADPGSLVPELDAIIFRNFTGDAPGDHLSAFAVEMTQMACVLKDATPRSLVLVDELGKGTEVGAGTALTAAMLSELLDSGARCFFATHLHGLLDLMANTAGISYCSMEVVEQLTPDGRVRLVPTRRVVPGSCTRSLALDVARDVGLPADVLEVAQQECEHLQRLGGFKALITASATQQLSAGSKTAVRDDNNICAVTHEITNNSLNGRVMQKSTASSKQSRATAARGELPRMIKQGLQGENHSYSVEVQQDRHQQHVKQVVAILAGLAAGQASSMTAPGKKQGHALADGSYDTNEGTAGATVPVQSSAAVHHLYKKGKVALQPLAAHAVKTPVLYVVYYESLDIWHAGDSVSLATRWKSHKYKYGIQDVQMWYIVLDTPDSRQRKRFEGRLHVLLDSAGVPLDSKHDAHWAR